MATFTLRAEPASVYVVFLVTGHAGRRESDTRVRRRGVAVMAPDSFVAAVQREAGAGVMIEVPNLPISRVVAGLAADPQLATMDVVAFMTGVAVDGCLVLVEDSFVATVTRHRTMLAEQRICGVPIVIKERGVPSLLGMALVTSVSELGVVYIVLLVARVAVGRRLIFEQRALMAVLAFRPLVVSL